MPDKPLSHAQLQPRRYSARALAKRCDPFYCTARWLRARRMFLRRQPCCVNPYGAHAAPVPATDVDHIVPIKRGGAPYDPANLQGLCRSCHSRKTQAERWTQKRS